MLAPIDAFADLTAEGQTIRLRLTMRTLALAEEAGIDLFDPVSGARMSTIGTARLVRCLATVDQPDMRDEDALALVLRHGDAVQAALGEAMRKAVGAAPENPPPAESSAPTQ